MRTNRMVVVLLWAVLAAGCATKPIPVSPEFWGHTETKVAIAIASLPQEGRVYREGHQGLLDMIITNAMDPGEARCARMLTAERFANITEIFRRELEKAGYKCVVYSEPIELEAAEEVSHDKDCFDRDLSGVFQQTGCDTLMLLQLVGFGTARTYYGFTPQSDPKGCAVVRGLMIARSENEILWDSGRKEGMIREPVIGPWAQEPDYPNLTGAVERAIEKSKKFLLERFFEERLGVDALDGIDMHAGETPEQKKLAETLAHYMQGVETTSAVWMSCSKPYRLTQNCSFWTGAAFRISLDGVEAKIAGSEDGTVVLIQGPKLTTQQTWALDSAFGAIATLFEKHEIHITKVVGAAMPDGTFWGYFLLLDKDGYSLLREHAVSKE